MCKHILNAQVSIRAPCCKLWYDCAECHAEAQTHNLAKTAEMTFMCKKCKKAFRKDMSVYEESDEYCPHCDNHYVRLPFSFIADEVYASKSGYRREDTEGSRQSGRRGYSWMRGLFLLFSLPASSSDMSSYY
ncbi:CHY zinc finger domain-containing protein, partial [Mycena olivaceomarginata]